MIKLESAHIEEVRGIRKLDIDFQKSITPLLRNLPGHYEAIFGKFAKDIGTGGAHISLAVRTITHRPHQQ